MKLIRNLSFASVGVGTVAAVLTAVQGGCGSSSTGPGSSSSSSESSTHSTSSSGSNSVSSSSHASASSSTTTTGSGTLGQPPPPPKDAGVTTASTVHNFAIHNLYVGDSEPDAPTFTVSSTAWEGFGYNIDGLVTTATSTDVCTRQDGAAGSIQIDGNNGIDNSFGRNIVSLIGNLAQNLSQTVSADIAKGSFTILLDTVGLTASPTQSNTGLTAQVFGGGAYAGTPPLTGSGFSITDNWPVSQATLVSVDAGVAGGSTIVFPSAYINNGTWVNGSTAGNLALSLSLAGQTLSLTIHHTYISFVDTVDGSGQHHATSGQISGVLEFNEFLSAIQTVAGNLGYCSELPLILGSLTQAQDILVDGTNTEGMPCNAISIGLGFDADEIAPPSTVAAPGSGSGTGSMCGSGT